METSKSRNISRLVLFALLSLVAYVLLEMLAQYAFEATYEARFSGLSPVQAEAIEDRVRSWPESLGVHLSIERSSGPERQVDLGVSMKLVERGFSTLSEFISDSGLGDYSGQLTFSRDPSPLGRMMALLASLLLFLLLFRTWLVSSHK